MSIIMFLIIITSYHMVRLSNHLFSVLTISYYTSRQNYFLKNEINIGMTNIRGCKQDNIGMASSNGSITF